jgi:hypothetical protein
MPSHLMDNSQLHEEYNQLSSFELCHYSQELVQDLVSKTIDFVTHLRPLSFNLLTNDQNSYLIRKAKVEESLKCFEVIFQRLRVLGALITQRQVAVNREVEQKPQCDTAALDLLTKEKEELIEQLRVKNRYIKLAIDKTSDIIWQINSIQTLRQ